MRNILEVISSNPFILKMRLFFFFKETGCGGNSKSGNQSFLMIQTSILFMTIYSLYLPPDLFQKLGGQLQGNTIMQLWAKYQYFIKILNSQIKYQALVWNLI